MLRSRHRTRRAALGGAAVLAAVLTVPSQAASAPPDRDLPADKPGIAQTGDVASGSIALTPKARSLGRAKFGADASAAESLSAYWTPKRMRNATPAAADPQLRKAEQAFTAKMKRLQRQGRQPAVNDGPVREVSGARSTFFTGKATPGLQAASNPNAPYYTPTAYTQGKVFFTKPGIGNFVCSGTIINSEGKDTVWTAGHCVHGGSGQTWHSNWSFVPAYDDDLSNPRPYGTWTSRQLWTKGDWASSSDFSEDMGVSIMNTRNGWHIVDYFGGQGLTVNRGKNVYVRAFGYPAESPFDGGNLYRCQGTTSPEWDAWIVWSQTVKIPCNMTRGSSGGAWLYGYDGNWGQLNGVNSRIDRIVNPTIMLSPYFDNDAWNLYNSTRNL